MIRHCSRSIYSENISPLILCLGSRRMNQRFSADGASCDSEETHNAPISKTNNWSRQWFIKFKCNGKASHYSLCHLHLGMFTVQTPGWGRGWGRGRGITPSVFEWWNSAGKKVTKQSLSVMHFSIGAASSMRWALEWIIKCKLPSVICHVVWGAQGVCAASRCYSALPRQNLSCGSHFSVAVLIARWRSQTNRLSKITFVRALIASLCNGNERPERENVVQVPADVLPDPPSCFCSARNTLFSHI